MSPCRASPPFLEQEWGAAYNAPEPTHPHHVSWFESYDSVKQCVRFAPMTAVQSTVTKPGLLKACPGNLLLAEDGSEAYVGQYSASTDIYLDSNAYPFGQTLLVVDETATLPSSPSYGSGYSAVKSGPTNLRRWTYDFDAQGAFPLRLHPDVPLAPWGAAPETWQVKLQASGVAHLLPLDVWVEEPRACPNPLPDWGLSGPPAWLLVLRPPSRRMTMWTLALALAGPVDTSHLPDDQRPPELRQSDWSVDRWMQDTLLVLVVRSEGATILPGITYLGRIGPGPVVLGRLSAVVEEALHGEVLSGRVESWFESGDVPAGFGGRSVLFTKPFSISSWSYTREGLLPELPYAAEAVRAASEFDKLRLQDGIVLNAAWEPLCLPADPDKLLVVCGPDQDPPEERAVFDHLRERLAGYPSVTMPGAP